MNQTVIILLAGITGGFIAAQGAINSRLASYLSHPIHAGFISFSIGLIAILVFMFSFKTGLPSVAQLKAAPGILFIGGFLGSLFILMNIYFVPKIGVVKVVLAVMAGQVIASIFIDHFGWFGVPRQAISMQRIIGACCVIIGVAISNTND
jgi:bacterial/archaeal transporter family-2 protein